MTHTLSLTSSMLAFARSLEISEALMEGVVFDDPKAGTLPILIEPKGVRGQTSNDTPEDGVINAGGSNPQVVETAVLPKGANGLRIRFSLTVVPNAKKPCAAGREEVSRSYSELFAAYAQAGGPRVLALRYLTSIATGAFAWRNRSLAQNPTVTVSLQGKNTVVFDCTRLSTPLDFSQESLEAAIINTQDGPRNLTALIEAFVEGLIGRDAEFFTVFWQARVPEFSQVFPSQEYVASGMQSKEISRTLASIPSQGKRLASIHSQKIGAAVRMIDTWHNHPEFGAVPINPYAGVQELNIALRHGAEAAPNLYDLMRKPDAMIQSIFEGAPNGDAHFFIANLIRGGVYGSTDKGEKDSSKKKKAKAGKEQSNV